MQIVVLDGFTLNPGDLSWDAMQRLGSCTVYDRTDPAQIVERARGAQVVLTNKVRLTAEVIEQLPQLKYIGVLATGYNVVDLNTADDKGIVVTNVPAYSTASVAQMVFALLLELTQQVGHHAREVHNGRWSACRDFCFWDKPMVELEGLTMGVVGYGHVGKAVIKIAQALGMKILVATLHPRLQPISDVSFVDIDTLFSRSDVVSLHCPLTEATEKMVNADRIASMKKSAYLINTGRGPLIDEQALAEGLKDGQLAGAGVDVLAVEPPDASNPLLNAPNCVITPHIAWATHAARTRLMNVAVDNVGAFLEGVPQNIVNNPK